MSLRCCSSLKTLWCSTMNWTPCFLSMLSTLVLWVSSEVLETSSFLTIAFPLLTSMEAAVIYLMIKSSSVVFKKNRLCRIYSHLAIGSEMRVGC